MARKRKTRRSAKTAGRSVFARAPRPADKAVFARAPKPAARSVFKRASTTPQPASSAVFERATGPKKAKQSGSRRAQVVKLLEARGVEPYVANKIAFGMEPTRFYMLRIYGYASSDPNDLRGDEPVLQATYVGSGIRLWSRAIGYASKAPIDDATIVELMDAVIDRPLWGPDTVKTVDGPRVYGNGSFQEYADRQKQGRRQKANMRQKMTAAERRADRKRKNAVLGRRLKTEKRARDLEKAGDFVGADRLRRRSKRARTIDM
jgi:hypothetical protein